MKINSETLQSINKKTLYWVCQIIGWGTVSTYWAYTVYTRDNYTVGQTFLNYVLDVGIGIFLTHMYRNFALKAGWNELPIQKLLLRLIPSVLILAVLYVVICNIKWYFFWTNIKDDAVNLIDSIFYWNPILITGLRLMSIWILAYHLYHYYQKEVVTARENAELSLLIKQTQLDNLSAQLNPHFLFNSLNSIKSLVEEDPKTARRAIDLLSDLLRSSLYEKDKDLITIKEELALVNDYVELEKLRFEERLEIEIELEKELENKKIPTLSIQLLVENAIKHGIDKLIDGGLISVHIYQKDNKIYIKVQNPGKIETGNSEGVGLKNLKDRLKIQYKDKASFSLKEIESNKVEGTILIPNEADENI